MSGRSCRAARATAASVSWAGAGCLRDEVGSSFPSRRLTPGAAPPTAFGEGPPALPGSQWCAGGLVPPWRPPLRALQLCSPGFWLPACGSCLASRPCAPLAAPCSQPQCSGTSSPHPTQGLALGAAGGAVDGGTPLCTPAAAQCLAHMAPDVPQPHG